LVEDVAVLDLDHDRKGLRTPVSLPGFVELNVVVPGREEVVKVGRYRDLRAIVGHDPGYPEQDYPDGCPETEDKIPDPYPSQLY
jgi:hypothetical protein